MNDQHIYRYILSYEGGTAPNPYGGFCTLAICKPAIRRTARAGDWILGFRAHQHDRVVYAMQVAESIAFEQYWRDPRFKRRRPDITTIPTDNIYRPVRRRTPDRPPALEWVPNQVHPKERAPKDLGGKHVLIATRIWYFGDHSPSLPANLASLQPRGRAHVVHNGRQAGDMDRLLAWLGGFPRGVIGNSIDGQAFDSEAAGHCTPCSAGAKRLSHAAVRRKSTC